MSERFQAFGHIQVLVLVSDMARRGLSPNGKLRVPAGFASGMKASTGSARSGAPRWCRAGHSMPAPDILNRAACLCGWQTSTRSEEHTSELQSLMRISYAVFCLKKKTKTTQHAYT